MCIRLNPRNAPGSQSERSYRREAMQVACGGFPGDYLMEDGMGESATAAVNESQPADMRDFAENYRPDTSVNVDRHVTQVAAIQDQQ
jgi:hypothetical protein